MMSKNLFRESEFRITSEALLFHLQHWPRDAMFKNLTEAETSALVEARRSFQEHLGVGRHAWEMAFPICRMKNILGRFSIASCLLPVYGFAAALILIL